MGSRHLQGLSKISQKINVTVLDPNHLSLKNAKERFNLMPASDNINSINYITSFNELINNIDIAIIATNSNKRREVIDAILNIVDVKYFILEKIVFQSISDFEQILQLFKKRKIKSWVNCPRRIWPFYQTLKKELTFSNLSLIVSGSNWGIASNSIHFLDLFVYLTSSTKISIGEFNLTNKIHQSKRKGFIELEGTVEFFNKHGVIQLTHSINDSISEKIRLITDYGEIEIDEANKKYKKTINSSEDSKGSIEVPLQSEITNLIVTEILKTDSSSLITLENSYKLHKPFLELINQHLYKINGSMGHVCPIS